MPETSAPIPPAPLSPSSPLIRVLIADDHTIVREGLARLLGDAPDLAVAGQAVDGREALDKVAQLEPNVLLLDLTMPGLHGLEVLRQVRRRFPATRVLILSMHKNEAYVAESLRAGAAGYILKDSAASDVVAAIRAVHRGEQFLSPAVAEMMGTRALQAPDEADPKQALYQTLTEREREVFQLLAEGSRNQAIARKLHVSVKTIETHRAHILAKLKLGGIADLVKYAIELGLLKLDAKPPEEES